MSIPKPRILEGVELPPGLHDLPRPPLRAFLWGALPPRPRVAIVGSRGASPFGLEMARLAAERLARAGFSVISGGALGIDTMAHRGALAASRATLVVAPAGLDRAYPKENVALFREILDAGGGYLSIARPNEPAFAPAFFARNAALVALSDVVLLGEAKLDSGAMNALAAARRLGRHSFVLPTGLDVETSRGSELASRRFGAPTYFRIDQLVDVLAEHTFDSPDAIDTVREIQAARQARRLAARRQPTEKQEQKRTSTRSEPADGPEREQLALWQEGGKATSPVPAGPDAALVHALRTGARSAEDLREATGLPLPELQHRLLLLVLEGSVVEDEQGLLCYVARDPDE